jgi:hypothetical protein
MFSSLLKNDNIDPFQLDKIGSFKLDGIVDNSNLLSSRQA